MEQSDSRDSFGSYLRSLRETKGGSLEDMSRATRVGVRHLEALESNQLSDLPAPVFVKGFIRAYCSFLSERPDEALVRYQELIAQRAAAESAGSLARPSTSWTSSSVLLGLGLLVLLGLGLLVLNMTVKRAPQPSVAAVQVEAPKPPPAAQAPGPAVTPPHPAATPVAVPVEKPSPKSVGPSQRLVVRAVEPTWIRVQADEGRVAEELLPAGATREWTAEKRFVLTIGNAGGVELELNGKALPPLGTRGAVIQRLELPQAAAPDGS